ncbi:type II toxin-antitoxin system HicA family toxin [Candidatus Accumulibacter vicinus]|uniref:type II toxin-antitoxin system HicA family toxin n=1 Tax=Candidatus Accumulibacter vicinus TaxID=2954382 RepID=UPI00235B6C3C|nr:type II toxin-antitoxin system HicA family toxin [Candidatus Accumulibacter vicinus]
MFEQQRPTRHPSGANVVRVLERLGFEKLHQSGSHVIMRRGSTGCVVPIAQRGQNGHTGGVLRQADVSPEEFIAAL